MVLRAAVRSRAGDRCEYCHLPTTGQIATFPIDHVIPRTDGGLTVFENLALACPHCNAHKWAFAKGTDSETATDVPLYNPRLQIWSENFSWSISEIGILIGQTSCGRVTIRCLQKNHPNAVLTRRLMAKLGFFEEIG